MTGPNTIVRRGGNPILVSTFRPPQGLLVGKELVHNFFPTFFLMQIGYYLPQFNWSIRFHNGDWCLFSRQPEDQLATTEEQRAAIRYWAASNIGKYDALHTKEKASDR